MLRRAFAASSYPDFTVRSWLGRPPAATAEARPMPSYYFAVVDAFTDTWGAGNPAGVVCGCHGLPADRLQAMAAELRLESAFVVSTAPRLTLRYFAPNAEIALCGHATLATAFALDLQDGTTVDTPAGPVRVHRSGDEYGLGLPKMPGPEPLLDPALILAATGVRQVAAEPVTLLTPAPMALLPLANPAAVDALHPDMPALAAACRSAGVAAVVVFAPHGGHRIRQRVFAPAIGLPEDFATGSASSALAQALRRDLSIEQGDAGGRPSRLRVENTSEGATVWGRAVVVARGRLYV